MKFRFSPIAKKRIQKFKNIKRSYYSLIILATLYFISLFAEFIANDNPLIIKFNNKFYFPIFKFYSERDFLADGELTEANYKKLNEHPIFTENKKNYMIFPIIPFSPNEIEKVEHGLKNEMTISVRKKNMLTGIIYVNNENKINSCRYNISEIFEIENNEELAGKSITYIFESSTADTISQIIKSRYNQEKSQPLKFLGQTKSGKTINIRFTSFDGGRISSRGINIRINEDESNFFITPKIKISKNLDIIAQSQDFFRFIGYSENNNMPINFIDVLKNSKLQDTETLITKITDKFKNNIIETEKILTNAINEKNGNLDEYEIELYKEKMKFPFKPTARHLFGLDEAGRDILARLIYAFRLSLTFGLILVFSAMSFGFIIGAIQGYAGGIIDITFQRLIEIWAAIPFLYVIILLGDIFGKGFLLLLICYAIFNWIGISYYIRAEFLKIKQFQYIEAARAIGLPWYKTIFRHILPNSLTPIISFLPFSLMAAISVLSALDYLGYGLPAPTPSWGELLGQAQIHKDAWWLILFPAITLFITMLLTVFIGEGIREAFDHKKMIKYK